MQVDPLKTPRSVDAKTAEEALSLALRLQQERGERISIDELQKTAEEAGIDREYLESALQQVTTRQAQPPLQEEIQPRLNRKTRVMLAAGLAMGISLLTVLSAQGGDQNPKALFFPFLLLMFGIGFFVRTERKKTRSHKDRDR